MHSSGNSPDSNNPVTTGLDPLRREINMNTAAEKTRKHHQAERIMDEAIERSLFLAQVARVAQAAK